MSNLRDTVVIVPDFDRVMAGPAETLSWLLGLEKSMQFYPEMDLGWQSYQVSWNSGWVPSCFLASESDTQVIPSGKLNEKVAFL